MSLLEPPAETPNKARAMTITLVALIFVGAVILYFTFRYYPEKKAVENFFDALVAGDTTQAYKLWKPGENYLLNDFLADWGPTGYYGPVKSYRITKASAPRGGNAVGVTIEVSPFSPMPDASDAEKSRKTHVMSIWVLSSDKSFSFPP
jgi:hypothetical protein